MNADGLAGEDLWGFLGGQSPSWAWGDRTLKLRAYFPEKVLKASLSPHQDMSRSAELTGGTVWTRNPLPWWN